MIDTQKLDPTESHHVQKLLRAVEKEVGWQHPNSWSGSDFERLSNLIYEVTSARLSVTTLKRMWGRTSQNGNPSRSTLNILSEFVGAGSWQEFRLQQAILPSGKQEASVSQSQLGNAAMWITGLLFLVLIISALTGKSKPATKSGLDPDRITFEIEKVSKGIPNTVVFHYDLDGQQVDSLELQQTWDDTRRESLDPSESLVTSTYFSPGYYNAKLVANGEIVARRHVYLPSEGIEFMTMHEVDGNTYYRKNQNYRIENGIVYDHAALAAAQYDNFAGYQLVNLLEEPPIAADTFQVGARLKVNATGEDDPCEWYSFLVTGSLDVYFARLGNKGCAGEFYLYLGGKEVIGKNVDLSKLGATPGTWSDLTLSRTGHKLTLTLNGNTVSIEDVPSIGPVGGVRLISYSLTELEKLRVSDDRETIDLLSVY